MLITENYRELNKKLHESNKHYGTSGHKWASLVQNAVKWVNSQDVLDYGCGKSTLAQNLPFDIQQYDPAIAKYSESPEPAHIVVCTDVLEHIEPELIDNVLADLARLTKSMLILSIANRPAKKTLDDGRNAHLIQENESWWLNKLFPNFWIMQFQANGVPLVNDSNSMLEYLVIATPKKSKEQICHTKSTEHPAKVFQKEQEAVEAT